MKNSIACSYLIPGLVLVLSNAERPVSSNWVDGKSIRSRMAFHVALEYDYD